MIFFPIPRLFLFCSLFLTAAFFGNVLWGSGQFAFRDGAHFYYPLYQYTQQEWTASRIPLWLPYENLGQPLLANPVSGVFYPPKILFFLPLDFTYLYHLFVVLHVFFAAVSMYRLARFFERSEAASTLAAISYTFGGAVLYQHLNVVFLIGATWFPEFLRCAFQARRSRKFSFGIPFSLAMMILGGDIQAAYHGAIAVFLILGFRRALTPLILAFLLTSVQILPSWELAKHCNRADGSSAASIWTASKTLYETGDTEQILDGLLCRNLSERGHARAMYNFSVPPWKIFEYVWPNFSGSLYPQNARWTSATPWDRFVWIPSLYCGVIPFLLFFDTIINVLLFKKKNVCENEISHRKAIRLWFAVFLVLLFGSFGLFGPGWLINVYGYGAKSFGNTSCGVGHPVGGVYWLMNLLLPGYAQFRYPAKLLTLAAIPLSMIAAYGFDRIFSNDKSTFPVFTIRILVAIILLSTFTMFVVLYATSTWDDFVQKVPRCLMFGPFQKSLAKTQLTISLLHGVVMLLVFLFFLFRNKKTKGIPQILVVLLAVDIFFANRNMVPTVDREYFRYESPFLEKMASTQTSVVPQRIYRYSIWYPPFFTETSSPQRLEESVLFDRLSLWPKYTLENRITTVNVLGTMSIQSYSDYMREIRSPGAVGIEKRLAEMGCQYVVLPERKRLNRHHAEKIASDKEYDAALWKLKNPIPLVRIDGDEKENENSVRILLYEPNRIIIETDLKHPRTLTLLEQHWPGWKAFLVHGETEKQIAIFPVQKVFRGVKMPSGRNIVTFRYDPQPWKIGALLSCGTWIVFGITFFVSKRGSMKISVTGRV